MQENTVQLNYTTINHEARKKLGLTTDEYCIADIIHNLSTNPNNKEGGWCYASKEKIAEFLGIGRATVFRALSKLLEKGLMEHNPEVKNLIKSTSKWYENVIIKRPSQNETTRLKMRQRPSQNETDDSLKMIRNNDINNKDNNNNIILHSEPTNGSLVNKLILLFESINPSYEKFYSNKTQRKSMENLIKRFGFEKVQSMLEQLPEIVSKPFAPMITTPCQLENKLGELILFVKKENGKKGGVLYADNL